MPIISLNTFEQVWSSLSIHCSKIQPIQSPLVLDMLGSEWISFQWRAIGFQYVGQINAWLWSTERKMKNGGRTSTVSQNKTWSCVYGIGLRPDQELPISLEWYKALISISSVLKEEMGNSPSSKYYLLIDSFAADDTMVCANWLPHLPAQYSK